MAKDTDLTVKITAKDSASKVIEEVAKDVEKLEGKDHEVTLTADDEASKVVEDVATQVDELEAHHVELQLDGGKFEQTAHELQDDVHRIAEEARANPVEVKVDTAAAVHGIDEVGKSADSSKSVLANMIGNSTQDLGDLGGVAGSAGVAIGQMGEYMADAALAGEGLSSVIRNFALVAGPVAALSVILPLLIDNWDKITGAQDSAAESAKKLKGAQDALKQGQYDKAVEDLATQYDGLFDAAEKAGISVSDVVKFISGASDVLPGFNTNIQTANDTIANAAEISKRMGISYEAAFKIVEQLTPALQNARGGWAQNNTAMTEGDTRAREIAGALGLVVDASGKVTEAAGPLADKTKDAAAAADAHRQAVEDETAAMLGQNDAMRGLTDSHFAFNKASRDAAQAVEDLDGNIDKVNKSTDSAETKQREIAQLYDDTAEKVINQAEAAQQLAEDTAAASGTTFSATQKLDAYNASLLTSASTTNGPVHDALVTHIATVNGIPEEKVTEILATTPNIDEQKRLIDEASRARETTIHVSAVGLQAIIDQYNQVKSKQITVDVFGRTHVDGAGAMAGTPYAQGGVYRVGEAGPELVTLPRGARVDTAGRTMMADRSTGAGNAVYNITVNVPVGAPTAEIGRYVADALDAHERRTGSRRRAVA